MLVIEARKTCKQFRRVCCTMCLQAQRHMLQPMCTQALAISDEPVFEGSVATYADCDVHKGAQEHCLQCPSHHECCLKGDYHCEHSKQYLMICDNRCEAFAPHKCTVDSMPFEKVQNITVHDGSAIAWCTHFAAGAGLSVHLAWALHSGMRFSGNIHMGCMCHCSHGMHVSLFTWGACVMARSPSEPPASCASRWDF